MRLRFALLLVGTVSLVAPGAASADFLHTVMPGESLTSIAAADGMSVSQLAAANGLSPTAELTTGSGIQVPPQLGGSVGSPSAPAATASASAAAPSATGSNFVHTVLPGESLTSIAAADGMSVGQLAAANGLSPTAELVSGTGIQIPPQGGGGAASSSAPSGTASAPSATPGATGSDFVHTVLPGESLTSIAAADGLSVGQLAAANGLSPTAELVSGTGIQIPGQSGGGVASSSAPAAAPASSGSYVVQPGDTLTAIAAQDGTSVQQLAADNGLNPLGVLPAGMVLNLSGGGGTASAQPSSSNVAASQPVGSAAEGTSTNPPYPTMQTVSPSEVGSIAAANGVPPALAQAIADQESGFNNNEVSTSDARGVMQILPGTWNYIQQDLTPGASPLAPASATDNVRGGVELLHSLLNATGGNAALAAAGYYQGLPSVEANGMYSSTQQYVNDVLSLQQQFNGG